MNGIAELARYLIPSLWLIWLAGWLIAARDVKPAQWKEARREAVVNRAPVLLGMMLMMIPLPGLDQRIVPRGPQPPFWGVVLTAAGLAFAGWARWHLGRNWSAEVSVKRDHALIRSGPYRLVRHPIYSGMVLALAGTALATGETRSFVGAGLIGLGFILKLQAEEARMRETFPEYADYCRRTARLIPGLY